MIEYLTEEIFLDDGGRRFHRHPANSNQCLVESGKWFSLGLCRKTAKFGGIPFDQFWMSIPSLYPQRGRTARNYDVIVEYFWGRCLKANSIFDDRVVDSYILAKLLPYVRSNGSRRVFNDAILSDDKRFGQTKAGRLAALEKQLSQSRDCLVDMVSFHRQTADILGPASYSQAVKDEYQNLSEELLGRGREAIYRWGENGIQVSKKVLSQWMATFVRRSGNETKKNALDILSYEAKTSFYRAYSGTWFDLLTHLERKYSLSAESVQFHRLTQFSLVLPSLIAGVNFFPFHGHILALHPGVGLFLKTRTGGELIADYLRSYDDDKPFQRLLNGLLLALYEYYLRHQQYSHERRKSPSSTATGDIESTAADQNGGRLRRLPGPKKY